MMLHRKSDTFVDGIAAVVLGAWTLAAVCLSIGFWFSVAMFIARITEYIDWSYWVVFVPLWGPVAFGVGCSVLGLLVVIVGKALGK